MATRKLRPGIRVDEFINVDDPDEQGTYETFWGRAWVHIKVADPVKPYMLANELIGSRLAASMGLPTLPGELARDRDGKNCWAAPRIQADSDTSLPPASASVIAAAHPNITAGMVVFDAWIHNQDRSADNVLYDERLGIWLIDHENSLALPDGSALATNPEAAAATPLGWHEFAREPIDDEALTFWTRRIQAVHNHVVERPIAEANQRGLITKPEATWITRYLLARRDRIGSLVPATPARPMSAPVSTASQTGQGDLFNQEV